MVRIPREFDEENRKHRAERTERVILDKKDLEALRKRALEAESKVRELEKELETWASEFRPEVE